ncbi:unnamed protein product [Brassica rapa subsp. trilocularis]
MLDFLKNVGRFARVGQMMAKESVKKRLGSEQVHAVWRERNRRRHGEPPSPAALLIKRLDKNLRNKFTVIRQKGDQEYEKGMETWFSLR